MLTSQREVYSVIPYFWSDQYDQAYEYLGHATTWDYTILRGSYEQGAFTVIYLDEYHVPLAVFYANEWDTRDEVEPFMAKRQPVDPEQLADSHLPLRKLT